jgi:hypothetical protein
MIPSFSGRIMTRLFLLTFIGVPVVLILGFFLPVRTAPGASSSEIRTDIWDAGLVTLFFVALIGCVVWEPIYHGLQQYRWEKDWPNLFVLLLGIPEGIVAYYVVREWGPTPEFAKVEAGGFTLMFACVWIASWLFVIGPIRVVFLRWRFHAGRLWL